MLKQIVGYERDRNSDVFRAMFAQRKTVFHDTKGWDVKLVDGAYEIDEYDRDDTVYLLSFDGYGQLVGSMRLLSTVTPHMMAGPFGAMFPDVSFRSPTIWEATRFVVLGDKATQPNGVSTAACELLLGTVQFGLQNGARHITGVYDSAMSRLYRRCGLRNNELGRHRTANHGTVCVGLWEIDEALESSVLAATGLGQPRHDRNAPRAA